MTRWIILSLSFALILLWTWRVYADTTPVPHGSVTVISENQSLTPGRPFDLALHFQLEKGWHIYWLNPGDSGQPPQVAWNLPAGITAGAIQWPAPERLGSSSIVDFGYTDAVTLLVPMRTSTALTGPQAARIDGELRVLVCREICVPGKAAVSVSIPVKSGAAAPDSQTRKLFAAARKSFPQPAPATWKFRVTEMKDNFILHGTLGRQVTQAAFFPLVESQIDNAAPQTVAASPQGFEMTLKKSDQLLKPIAQLKGVLELSPGQAFRIDAPVINSGSGK